MYVPLYIFELVTSQREALARNRDVQLVCARVGAHVCVREKVSKTSLPKSAWVRPGPSGPVQGPSGPVQARQGPSRPVRARPGPSGPARVHPGPHSCARPHRTDLLDGRAGRGGIRCHLVARFRCLVL